MEGETWLAIAIAVTGAIGSGIKIFFDWRKARDLQNVADHAADREHELEMAKLQAEATQKLSETALRASIVGIERHKKTMTPDQQKLLTLAIQDAAIEESCEGHLSEHVLKITERKGTKFYSPEAIKKALEESSDSNIPTNPDDGETE